MSAWEIRLAQPADREAILMMQSMPMQGSIRLSLSTGLKATDSAVVAFRGNQLMGMGARIRARHRWAGASHWVGVLTSFRSACSLLPRRTMMEMYRILRSNPAPDEPPWEITSILEENAPARRLLEAGLTGMPRYSKISRVTTFTFKSVSRPKNSADLLKTAESVEVMGNSCHVERIQGRRTAISGYAPMLGFIRPLLNPAFRLGGFPGLPEPGTVLKEAFVVDAKWGQPDRKDLDSFVREIRRAASSLGADLVHWGISSDHPNAAQIESRLRAWKTRSIIYAVHNPEIPAPRLANFMPEVSRL